VIVEKKIFENWSIFASFCPTPKAPVRSRVLKFIIYVPLAPKMLHTKFEKNWTGSYQEVKNVQYLAPPWGQNLCPGGHEIHNFGRGLPALHHHAFSFSCTSVVVEKMIFENWSIFGSFCPAPKAPRGQGS
jgi:hypothetical protein